MVILRKFSVEERLSEWVARKGSECAAEHPHITPWDWLWSRTSQWDEEQSNWEFVDNCEPDFERSRKAWNLAKSGNFSESIQIWTELAERGSLRALIELGNYCEHGIVGPVDQVEAELLFHRANAAGSQYAMLKCAQLAADRNDFQASEGILQPGVDALWAPAMFWQAWYRYKRRDSDAVYQEIFPLLKAASKRGHPAARMILANFMVRGKLGLILVPFGLARVVRQAIVDVLFRPRTN